ncbi:MAG: ATP-binding cassette domain-containing protein [Caldilineaceae bacterium]
MNSTNSQPKPETPPALVIDDLTVAYNSKPAIWDVDLSVPEGVLMAIVGPNGAGKSTLIKAALNLIPRSAGR